MKKQMVYLLVALFTSSFAYADCVLETGETTSCENEQTAVDSALTGLVVDTELKYCKTGYKTNPSNGLLNCRGIITYKDASTGVATDSVFTDHIFWEKAATATSPASIGSVKVYFVKKSNGNYETAIDENPGLSVSIDKTTVDAQGQLLQDDVSVTFTNGLPAFVLTGQNLTTEEYHVLDISYTAASSLVVWDENTSNEVTQLFDVVKNN